VFCAPQDEDDYYADEIPRSPRLKRYGHEIGDLEESNPRIRILLLEDIDRFFSKEEGFKTPVSFSAILNALDGVAQRKNSILIATANNPEKIDSQVLFRPGRFDLRIPFEAPNREGIRSFLAKLSEEDSISPSMIDKVADAARGHSLAFVKGVYLAAANKAFARTSTQIYDEDITESLQEFLSNLGRDIKSNKGGAGF
jgi:SpoVK/Ycf46/Vps4 family AAA+-type ATPase